MKLYRFSYSNFHLGYQGLSVYSDRIIYLHEHLGTYGEIAIMDEDVEL